MTSVTNPNSVTSIGDNAFNGCNSLASIILLRSTPPEAHDTSFNTYETTVLIVPAGAKSAYQSADVWKNFVTIREIKDGDKFEKDGIYYRVISVADQTVELTFKGETYDEVDNEYQGDVVIPQTVSYEDVDFTVVGVGEKALYGCDNIRKLSVPLTVNYFDKGSVNSETLRELYWNSTSRFSKSIFVNPDVATNMILYIAKETECDYAVNVVRNGVAEYVVLTDALPLQITTGFKAKRISYTRHFDKVTVPRKPGGWESIVLPFDVQSFVSEEAGEISPFNSGKSGAKPFMLAQMTGSGFAVATEMKANVPYILVMPNSEVYSEEDNISGEVMFYAESASGVTVYPTADAKKAVGKEFDLVPTYEGAKRDFAVYVLNEGMYNDFIPGSAFVSGLRDVKPFEAYASVESKPANAKTYFVIGGNGAATDIMRLYDDMFDGLEIDSRDGVLYIQSPKAQNIGLYGSDGRLVRILRLTEGSNTVTGLSKGVYVIGKKKVGV